MLVNILFDLYSLAKIDRQAVDLFLQGDFASVQVSSPYMQVRLAIAQQDYQKARQLLADDSIEPISMVVAQAYIDLLTHTTTNPYLEILHKLSSTDVHRAMRCVIEGETLRTESVDRSLRAYRQGLQIYRQLPDDASISTQCYICVRLSSLATTVGMQDIARTYQADAETLADHSGFTTLRAWAAMNAAYIERLSGNFDVALGKLDFAEASFKHERLLADLREQRAHVLLLSQRIDEAHNLLKNLSPPTLHHAQLGLMQGNYAEAEAITRHYHTHPELQQRAQTVRLTAKILQNTVEESCFSNQKTTINMLLSQQRLHEASEAQLAYAWANHRLKRFSITRKALAECIQICRSLQTAQHLCWLYCLSLQDLAGWWRMLGYDQELRKARACDHPGIQLFAFNRIEIYVGSKHIRHNNLSGKLAFYMLLRKEASLRELAAEFWPLEDFAKVSNRLGVARSTMTDAFGIDIMPYDKQRDRYCLIDDFPTYYDARDFETTIADAAEAPTPQDRLDAYRKAIKLYAGSYLRGYDHQIFSEEGYRYEYLFDELLEKAIPLAEDLGQYLLAVEWKSKRGY